MALYPFVHVSALELHALSHYPGNRQNDRQTETPTDYCMPSLCMHTGHNEGSFNQPGLPHLQFEVIWCAVAMGYHTWRPSEAT